MSKPLNLHSQRHQQLATITCASVNLDLMAESQYSSEDWPGSPRGRRIFFTEIAPSRSQKPARVVANGHSQGRDTWVGPMGGSEASTGARVVNE